jgi:hypothetical protein
LSTLRIATWNTYNNPNDLLSDADFSLVFDAIGRQTVQGVTKSLDLLALTESDPASDIRMESILDSLYATTEFERITSGVDGGGDTTGFLYDARSLDLLEHVELLGPLVHNTMRGKFRPVGTNGEADFYAYAVHLKSGGTTADAVQRQVEMAYLRADADSLGEGASVIYAGDLNLTGSSEGAWTEIVAAGNGRAVDPANAPGNWSSNSAYVDLHTHATSQMRSRFDFILPSDEFFNSTGIEYATGSMRVFGNNGSHGLDNPITAGNGAAQNVLQGLLSASDHLPVIADFDVVSDPAVLIHPTGGNTTVIEGRAIDTYVVELATQPTATVTVTVSPQAQLDVGAGPGVSMDLVFYPQDPLLVKTVVVQPTDDTAPEGTHAAWIQHTVVSPDASYDGLAVDPVEVEIRDDDAPTIVLNELDSDTPGTDVLEFVELYDGGVGNVSLNGLSVVFYNGADDRSYRSFDLDGFVTDSDGFFVLGNSAVPNVDLVFPNSFLQNGADAVALYNANGSAFPNGSPVTLSGLLDALVYDTNDADDPGLLVLLPPEQPQRNEDENGLGTMQSVARVADYGVQLRTTTFTAQLPTPAAPNAPPPAGISLHQGGNRTDVSEAGATDAYTLVLDTLPTANVTINIDPDEQLDLGNGPGALIQVSLTPQNGLIPQIITVRAAQDSRYEGNHVGRIDHWVESVDSAYAALILPFLMVNVADDDVRNIVINEVDSDTPGVDNLEFIELYDGGQGNMPLDGLVVILFNGNGDQQYSAFDLDGFSTSEQGFFVIGSAQVSNVDMLLSGGIQNGADAVALYEGNASEFVQVTVDRLQDALVYDTGSPDDPGLLFLLLPGEPQVNENMNGAGTTQSMARRPDGGESRRTSTYVAQAPTPGAYNTLPGDFDGNQILECADVDALVAEIASGGHRPGFDLTGDLLVMADDLDRWLQLAGALNLGAGRTYLRGDANLNGWVDLADFEIWEVHRFTLTARWCAGDFTADGAVDGSDFGVWNQNKGTSSFGTFVASPFLPGPEKASWRDRLAVARNRTFSAALGRAIPDDRIA